MECHQWRLGVASLLRAWFRRRSVPRAGAQVVEPNQVDLPSASVPRDRQQILHAFEAGLARQIICNVLDSDGHNRIDDDMAVLHRIAATGLDLRPRPDADAAPDSSAANPLA